MTSSDRSRSDGTESRGGVVLRRASASDAEAIARIWETGWADAHLGTVPRELIEARTGPSFDSRTVERLADTIVATRAGAIAGFVMVDGDQVDQLYLDRSARGAGIGGVLLEEAERLVAASGHRRAWLAVATGNSSARRFYERQGWIDEGPFVHPAPVPRGTVDVDCHRFRSPVRERPAAALPEPLPVPEAPPDPRRWRVLAVLGIAQLMLIIDVTVVAIALPEIGSDLALGRTGLTWVASIYALVFGGLMLLGGRAADVFGPRRLVITGLTLFTVASLLAGLAGGAELLLIARALQGAGAAMMSPAALSVIVRTFSGAELGRALGVWSGLGGAGAAIGVLLGGVLTAGPGWPWVFYVNVPLGAILLLALLSWVRPLPGAGGRLDVPGALIATAATTALVYGLVAAGDHGWLSPHTLIAAAAGIVGYALFAWRIRSACAPLVDPALLRRRPVVRGLALIFVSTALMIAVFFLGSFALQQLHGFTALETGLSFLPVAVGTILGSTLAGRLISSWGVRAVSVTGLLIAAAGLAAAAGIASMTVLIVATSIAGFGIGAGFVAAAGSLFSAVQPHEAGVASGALSTFHEFGAATGVSAVSSVAAVALVHPTLEAFAPGYWFAAAVAAGAGMLSLIRPKGQADV